MSFKIKFEAIKDEKSIIFLDDEARTITAEMFEAELKTGYRAGMVIVPMANAIQVQVAMMTPYHSNLYQMDHGFLVDRFEEYCRENDAELWIPDEAHEYFLGEIEYAE